MKNTHTALYSLPELYHHTFSWDLSEEIEFYNTQFSKSAFKVKNILEPACGSGRYFPVLEKAGYSVTGYDIMPEMISFAENYIKKNSLKKCKAYLGDMRDFSLNQQFDAAINPVNSFRYLLENEDILFHLKNTAALLKSGAYYIIEFAYAFIDPTSVFDQKWSRTLDNSTINACWQVLEENHKTLRSLEKSSIEIRSEDTIQNYEMDHITRLWLYEDFLSVVEQSGEWKLEAIYDHDFMEVISDTYFGEMGNLFHILKKK